MKIEIEISRKGVGDFEKKKFAGINVKETQI